MASTTYTRQQFLEVALRVSSVGVTHADSALHAKVTPTVTRVGFASFVSRSGHGSLQVAVDDVVDYRLVVPTVPPPLNLPVSFTPL